MGEPFHPSPLGPLFPPSNPPSVNISVKGAGVPHVIGPAHYDSDIVKTLLQRHRRMVDVMNCLYGVMDRTDIPLEARFVLIWSNEGVFMMLIPYVLKMW